MTERIAADFSRLFRRHYDAVWRCAKHMGVPPADVDDLVQEVFTVALRRYADFDGSERERAWLYAILRNLRCNQARRQSRRRALLGIFTAAQTDASAAPGEVDVHVHQELGSSMLDEFLAGLDDAKREAFVLSKVAGMSSREIAEVLGANVNTVQSRLREVERAFTRRFGEDSHRARLLGIAKADEPQPGARAKTWVALMLLPPSELVAPAAPDRAATFGLAKVWPTLGRVVLGVTATSAVGAAVVLEHQRRNHAPENPVSVVEMVERRDAAGADVATPRPSALVDPPIVVSPLIPGRRPPPATPPHPHDAEQALLGARRLIRDGQPGAALTLLEDGPHSTVPFIQRSWVKAEIDALCQLAREGDAQQRAQAWAREHPEDFEAQQLASPCSH